MTDRHTCHLSTFFYFSSSHSRQSFLPFKTLSGNPKLEILRNSSFYLEGSVRSRDLDKKSKRCNLEMSHSLLIACKCSQCLSNSRGHILKGRKNHSAIFINVIDLRRILYLCHAYANIDLIINKESLRIYLAIKTTLQKDL